MSIWGGRRYVAAGSGTTSTALKFQGKSVQWSPNIPRSRRSQGFGEEQAYVHDKCVYLTCMGGLAPELESTEGRSSLPPLCFASPPARPMCKVGRGSGSTSDFCSLTRYDICGIYICTYGHGPSDSSLLSPRCPKTKRPAAHSLAYSPVLSLRLSMSRLCGLLTLDDLIPIVSSRSSLVS